MKIGSKLCLIECTHVFSKNRPKDLVLTQHDPFFNSGLDFIMINILTKFREDWIKQDAVVLQ